MRHILDCRRTFIAFIGMVILGAALFSGTDTSGAIASICIGLAASNSAEKALKKG